MEGASACRFTNICIFCGSSPGKGVEFLRAANTLGRVLAARKIHVVYGGGSIGLMGAVSTAAYLGGSQVLGIIPKAFTVKNITGMTVGEELQVSSMHERMAHMLTKSDAFIALPGGYGTLEEIFQIISWAQLNIHQKPIGLLNVNNFFDGLLSFLDHAVEQKFIPHSARRLLISASTADELIDKLHAFVYVSDPVMALMDWAEDKSKKRRLDLTLRL